MATDDLSLLFRLRSQYDSRGTNEARAAVKQLQQSFGPELASTVSVTNKVFTGIGDSLTSFVSQRVPLAGGALARFTDGVKNLGTESPKTEKAITGIAQSIQSIATQSGKSAPQVAAFLSRFVQIEGQAKRNEAAFSFFGGSVDLIGNKTAKFLPELEKARTALATVSAESAAAGSSIAAIAGPIGVVVVALATLATASLLAAKEVFNLAKASAEYQGKLYDLSQQVGVSVETLSSLEVSARTTGGSIEGLVQSLGIFQKNLEEASQDIDSKAAKAFNKLGVETTDTEAALRQTVAALARMPEGFRQTAAALEVFGRGGKAFLAIAKETKGDIDKITESLKNNGLVTSEQAKLADEFNDQLVLLDVQLRGLGTAAIPEVLEGMKDLHRTLEDNRLLFNLLQGVVKAFAFVTVGQLRLKIAEMLPGLILTSLAFERIATAVGLINKNPLIPPGVPTPPEESDPFKKDLQSERNARLRLQGVLNFDFAAQQRAASAAIAQAQRDFEAGSLTRQELLEATIAGIKKRTEAEIEALRVERQIKLVEIALAKDDEQKRAQISNQILAIDIQIADKRHQLREKEKDERAKFRREEEANEIAHQQRLLEKATALDQVKITGIQQQVALRKKAALDGDKEIENIELTAIDRAQNLLVKRLALAGLDVAKQKEIKDEIQRLGVERTAIEQRHRNDRLQIVTGEAEIAIQLVRTKGDALIATVQALADARAITEEEAERRIAKIRLDALDAEIELATARGQDTRLLETQREAIQAETERNIEAGRQRDLENQRRYADELERIRERTESIERDTAEEVIRLMRLHFADRKTIIRAQRDLELAEEEARHTRVAESIRAQQGEVDAQIATLEKFIERLKPKTDEEIAEYDRLIEKLEALRQKREELQRQQETETERTNTTREVIKTEAQIEIANPDAALRDAFKDVGDAVTDLTGKFADLVGIGEQFALISDEIAEQIGGTLAGAFEQFAQGLGQAVANWVLLGETGPAVMRKILAQALASLAAEATVQAIKELALGFATLFFNPAESAAHFTAAGLWASIGGAAALAGRGIAGDLFKSKTGGIGERATGSQTGQIPSASLARNAGGPPQPVVVTVNVKQDPHSIVDVFTQDFRSGGQTRQVVNNDGGAD